ncbi:MAG: hypothetical protein E7618_04465, partial [Ruminococcaceae bacterium]|nr:hypothetical protein [Oscillospiraceae bacterium]
MKHRIRVFLALCSLAFCLSLLAACGDGEHSDTELTAPDLPTGAIEHFIYENSADGITILGYSGLEQEITIPDTIENRPVIAIAPHAFRGFSYLKRIVIPDTVQTIDQAFAECVDLSYVFIGNGVISMNGAFRGCTALTAVVGGNQAVYLDEAFAGCTALVNGRLPASAQSAVATYASCSSLQSVTLAEGITILDRTFENCTDLRSVIIPDSVTTTIAAFDGCTALSEVSGGLHINAFTDTFRNCLQLRRFTLGPDVTCLEGAFVGCTSLETVENLPTAVQYYKPSFTGCRSLRVLTIPAIAEDHDSQAYGIAEDIGQCESLESLTVLADIPMQTDFCQSFAGCFSLTELTLTEKTFAQFLRVAYTFADTVYEGDDATITKTVAQYRKASAVRVTDKYGIVNGISYTHIYGGDLQVFDPDALLANTKVLGFSDFQKTTYWCGYPDGGN